MKDYGVSSEDVKNLSVSRPPHEAHGDEQRLRQQTMLESAKAFAREGLLILANHDSGQGVSRANSLERVGGLYGSMSCSIDGKRVHRTRPTSDWIFNPETGLWWRRR